MSGVNLCYFYAFVAWRGRTLIISTSILFVSIFVFNKIYINENCCLLGYYAASSGNCLRAFRDNISVSSLSVKNPFLTLEDGTDRLSRNFGKQLPLFAT